MEWAKIVGYWYYATPHRRHRRVFSHAVEATSWSILSTSAARNFRSTTPSRSPRAVLSEFFRKFHLHVKYLLYLCVIISTQDATHELSDKILVLGNGGVKKSQRYEDDSLLNGYVMTLQKFEKLLRQEVANGNVNITESTIETDNIFELWSAHPRHLKKCSVLFRQMFRKR